MVLPLEPVTIAVGMSDSSSQGTSSTARAGGSAQRCGCRRPAPKVNSLSSTKCGSARSARGFEQRAHLRRGFQAESCLNRASAAPSSRTGRSTAGEPAPGLRWPRGRRDQRSLKSCPTFRIALRQRRAQRPLIDFRGEQQLIARAPRWPATRRPHGGARRQLRDPAQPKFAPDALDARAPGADHRRHRAAPERHRAPRRWRQRTGCCPSGAWNPQTAARPATFSRRSPAPSVRRARRGSGLPC